jgi:hypothetical protein
MQRSPHRPTFVSSFHRLVNGTSRVVLSCQFDTMFTEPTVPHCLQTSLAGSALANEGFTHLSDERGYTTQIFSERRCKTGRSP